MSRGRQIGMLGILLAVLLVGIALLPAKSPPAANTPAPAKPSAAAPATPPGLGSQIATTIANPQLATAFPGLNAPLLATQVAGIDRNQAATAITISGLLQNGACLNIKGVVMPNGGKIYYLPESYYYESAAVDKTKGDQYFCTAAEALAAGFTPGK